MPQYKSYDHRLKILAFESKDVSLFTKLGIPKSTVKSWLKNGINPELVTLEIFDDEKKELCLKIIELENKIVDMNIENDLMIRSKEILNIDFDWKRFPKKEMKEQIIKLYDSVTNKFSPAKISKVIGLSLARLKSWKNSSIKCELSDHSSCPKTFPTKATKKELADIETMIKHKKYSHFTISSLANYAIKHGLVYLSPTTWSRYAKKFQWTLPRIRKYKDKNKVGIRATKVNQIWHIDITVIKLIDNSKVYLQAIIDNYSRYIIAYSIFTKIDGENTKKLIEKAIDKTKAILPQLYCDSGIENLNHS
jgi:hypothetical protein